MMKWWLKNGYPAELAKTDRVTATKVLTDNLKSRFDAVYHKGGGWKKLDIGPQVVVYDPSRIYRTDDSLAKPGEIGSQVARKADGLTGTLLNKRTVDLPQEGLDKWWGGENTSLTVRWRGGTVEHNLRPSQVEFVQPKQAAASEVPINSLLLNPHGLAIARSKWLWEKTYRHPNTKPVVTMKLPDGSLYVLDGYHRIVQAMRDGKTTVPVVVKPYSKERLDSEGEPSTWVKTAAGEFGEKWKER
jgi:hypothetical protein